MTLRNGRVGNLQRFRCAALPVENVHEESHCVGAARLERQRVARLGLRAN